MARPNCPRCGSDLVVAAVADSPSEWVEELRGGNLRAHPAAASEVNWLCRACGHRWEPVPDADGDPAELAAVDVQTDAGPELHQYAELLKLGLERSVKTPTAETLKPLPDPRQRRRSVAGAALTILALTTVVVIALLPPASRPDVEAPRPSSAQVSVHDSGRAPPPTPERRGVRVVLDIRDTCWVRAVADGEVVASITLAPGETVVYRADRHLELTLGNAGGVKLRVSGEPVATGPPGDVVVLDLSWKRGDVLIERS